MVWKICSSWPTLFLKNLKYKWCIISRCWFMKWVRKTLFHSSSSPAPRWVSCIYSQLRILAAKWDRPASVGLFIILHLRISLTVTWLMKEICWSTADDKAFLKPHFLTWATLSKSHWTFQVGAPDSVVLNVLKCDEAMKTLRLDHGTRCHLGDGPEAWLGLCSELFRQMSQLHKL